MAESYPAGNLFSHLAETTAKFPDQTALIMGGEEPFQTYTFHELNQGVLHCAYYLGAKGIKKGNKVLLFVKPGYELTVIAFALIFLGAVPVIIDPGMGI